MIFARYLSLGSMGALIEDLDRRGIRTKQRHGRAGRVIGGIRFGVGPLAHLLKNRIYIGEILYKGELHRGEHEPILDRDLFEAVQTKIAANAVNRQVRLRGTAALLSGRIFDDRDNRMTPTHANKLGVRYRYYVSHAILQKRKGEAGSVARVPAAEMEKLVLNGLRNHLMMSDGEQQSALDDRAMIERYVDRVIVIPQALKIHLARKQELSDPNLSDPESRQIGNESITLAWTCPSFVAVKGIVHTPSSNPAMKPESRDVLLTAIIRARRWMDDIRLGRVKSLAEIATRECKCERHIRLLAPLAFVSPRIISAIVDGTAPAELTVTGLAKALPYCWAEQEQRFAL
jgi:site-specific DNA recombinase